VVSEIKVTFMVSGGGGGCDVCLVGGRTASLFSEGPFHAATVTWRSRLTATAIIANLITFASFMLGVIDVGM
jgi:hypothetical protein